MLKSLGFVHVQLSFYRADQSAMDAVYLDRQLIYAGQITRAMEFLAKKRSI